MGVGSRPNSMFYRYKKFSSLLITSCSLFPGLSFSNRSRSDWEATSGFMPALLLSQILPRLFLQSDMADPLGRATCPSVVFLALVVSTAPTRVPAHQVVGGFELSRRWIGFGFRASGLVLLFLGLSGCGESPPPETSAGSAPKPQEVQPVGVKSNGQPAVKNSKFRPPAGEAQTK